MFEKKTEIERKNLQEGCTKNELKEYIRQNPTVVVPCSVIHDGPCWKYFFFHSFKGPARFYKFWVFTTLIQLFQFSK